jgi:phage shock protein A
MVNETASTRMMRIEDKIDKMTESIIQLARVEEKIEDLETRRAEQHERMNRLSGKIDNIEKHVTTIVEKVAIMQKFAWVLIGIVATVIGAALTQFIS